MNREGWIGKPVFRASRVRRSPEIEGHGQGGIVLTVEPQVVRARRVVGFTSFEDWGEAAWTAKDLRP